MPSVGSTPTTSPATSTVNSSQNNQQSNNKCNTYTQCNSMHYQNNSTSSDGSTTVILNSIAAFNDGSNNSSSTTTSCISTPIHSPDLHVSAAVGIDNNPQTASIFLNRYSLNTQIATTDTTVATISTTAASTTIVQSPITSSLATSYGNHLNYNNKPNKNPFYAGNNAGHHQLSHPNDSTKFLVIQPAVSIDRDFDNDTGAPANENCNEIYDCSVIKTSNLAYNSINNNILENSTSNNNSNYYHEQQYPYYLHHHHQQQMQQQTRQNNLSNNFRFKYNSIYNQQMNQQHQQKSQENFLSKSANSFSGFTASSTPSSWRWCSFICAAMRCFGGGRNSTGSSHYTSTFSTRNYTQVKDDSASYGSGSKLSNHFHCVNGISGKYNSDGINNSGFKLNRNLSMTSSSYQNNGKSTLVTGPFATPRKTRDHMNNICYEL